MVLSQKIHKFVPVIKGGDPSSVKNHHLSLSNISKILEHFVCNKIIIKSGLLLILFDLVLLRKALRSNKINALFIKTYLHSQLLSITNWCTLPSLISCWINCGTYFGIDGTLWTWFKNHHFQRVSISSNLSNILHVASGVPHGN